MRNRRLSLLLIAIMGAVFSYCNKSEIKLSKEEMKQIVENRNADLAECFKASDAEKLALIYSDSAKLSPNGLNFVYGRNSIKAFWAEDFITSHVIEMNTDVLTIDGNSEIIYETGIATSKIMYNETLYNARVKYINVWRKQPNGGYLLDIDFWNKDKK